MIVIDHLKQALEGAFGTSSVRALTDSHFQIKNGTKNGWHDLWISNEDFKLRLHGKTKISVHNSYRDIIFRIDQHHTVRNDLKQIHEALRIGESIQHAQSVLYDHDLDEAIFVDGGWKNGHAKVAAILVSKNGDVDVKIRVVETNTSGETELQAVLLGMEMRSDDNVPIFSDCRAILDRDDVQEIDNIHWVPRLRNKCADHLSNMRRRVCISGEI